MPKKLKIQAEDSMKFYQGFNEFLDNCKARNLRPATIAHYQEGYKAITKFVDKDISIKDINKKTVDNFVENCKEKLNINSQSLFTYTRDFKTILYFFMRMEYLQEFKIQLPRVDKTSIETYSDAELKILLKKPDLKNCSFVEYRDWTLINFLLSTAVRVNSVINIKIKELDFENEVVYVNTTKNRKPLIIPLNPSIIKILKDYLKMRQHKTTDEYLFCTAYNKKLCKRTIDGSLLKYNHDRMIEKTGVYRYRHTFSKKFIINGGNPAILQKILGHSSLLTTQNYLNILVTDLKKEINQFNILEEFTNNDYIKVKG
jgi:integrase/recombinase XerD